MHDLFYGHQLNIQVFVFWFTLLLAWGGCPHTKPHTAHPAQAAFLFWLIIGNTPNGRKCSFPIVVDYREDPKRKDDVIDFWEEPNGEKYTVLKTLLIITIIALECSFYT